MNAITYTDLRQNLKTYMDKVIQDHDPLIITRKNNCNGSPKLGIFCTKNGKLTTWVLH